MHVRIIMHVYMSDTHGQGKAVHIQGPTIQRIHIQGPTIQTYEDPQGPGTMLLKSGTVPEIRGPLRPMLGVCDLIYKLLMNHLDLTQIAIAKTKGRP